MLTQTATPFEARIDPTTASDADLLAEYSVCAYDFAESVTPGNQRTNRYGRREDAYAKQLKFQVWARAYDAAYRAATAHPAVLTHDDAEAAADAAMGEILDIQLIESIWASCNAGAKLADIAAHRATLKAALKEVHAGSTMRNDGGNRHTAAPESKDKDGAAQARANRRIYGADPQSYGFEAGRSISNDGRSYDMQAVEDAIDAREFGALTESEEAIEWFIEKVTASTNATRDEVTMWLHTTGLTNEVEEYIDLIASSGSHEAASDLADNRRFPLNDIAVLTGESLATVKRRNKKAKDAAYSDCSLVGDLRSGIDGTRKPEVNPKTVSYALGTSLAAHAAANGQPLTKALIAAVPDAFFADYIAEYRADGSTAADIDPAFITEMRDAVTQAVKA